MGLRSIISEPTWIKLRLAKATVQRVLYRTLWFFPIDQKKIVFSNFNGKGYGDNPRYIAEEFARRKAGRLYWLCLDTSQGFPDYIHPLKYGSLSSLYHIATAAVWIDNNRKEPYITKRKSQKYLQTWHGSIALKKIEADVEDSLDDFYISNAKRDSSMIDLMISDSISADKLYNDSFWYHGKVIRTGTPRFDPLSDASDVPVLRQSLGIAQEACVVLYAPTFRNYPDGNVYDIDLKRVKEAFEHKTGKPTVILVRMHPHIPAGQIMYEEDVARDVSKYPDVYDLMKISDVLITDYSCLIFEFAVSDPKPVFAYAKDKDDYDRGFYFNLDDLPFLFATSNDELIEGIMKFEQGKYQAKVKSFYKDIELIADGHASERVVDYLLDNKWVR